MNILVSAGPTREYIDTVRFISNASSGKMGYAIAREAARRGHEVTLVSGPVLLKPPKSVTVVVVVSAAEMAQACKRAFREADVAVMTAAVCDYRPGTRTAHKLAKKDEPLRLTLEPTEDIAASLGRRKAGRLLIGFAMEDREPHRRAELKCRKKNFDLVVLNGLQNVGSDQATVELFDPAQGWSEPMAGSKALIARRLVRVIEEMAAS